VKLSPQQIADCKTDLLTFSKTVFNGVFRENWHHKEICDTLEKVYIGQIKRLIINMPPRYSKTELAVVNFIAWTLGNRPDSEYIHTSYAKALASKNAQAVRDLCQKEVYQQIFPRVQIRDDSSAKADWKTTLGGAVYAAGSGGALTGYGAGKMREGFGGCIIVDDPHKASEATSDTIRKGVIDWYSTTLESRTNSPDTPIILIMQRLHKEDLTGYLLNG
jgi:hypothetical protein